MVAMKTAFDGLPLVIGVVGHRNVPPDAESALREQFASSLATLQRDHPFTPLLLLTALAAGADTLAAEEALERGIDVVACLPVEAERFQQDFTPAERRRFAAVLPRC